MLSSTSFEAWPVRTFFNASAVKGKCPLPVIASPKRRKGMIKLSSRGVAAKFRTITVTALQRLPNIATATPPRITVVPHIGKIPMVIPRAAEKASCLGSAPLLMTCRTGSTILLWSHGRTPVLVKKDPI